MDEEYLYEEPKSEGRGRTAKKRAAKEVEKLAMRLVELPESELPNLPLDEELIAGLLQARQTKGHSSKKREIKHFSGLLRRDEELVEELRRVLAEFDMQHGQETAVHHDLETLRERLLAQESRDAALQEVTEKFPQVDVKGLLRLIKAVQHSNDKKAYREIFRRLRDG